MADAREDARKQYDKTRTEFEKLDTQDKTAFVLEATFQTIGQAVEETGRHLTDVLESVFDFGSGSWAEPGSWRTGPSKRDDPNPASPPSSKKSTRSSTRKPSDASEPDEEDE